MICHKFQLHSDSFCLHSSGFNHLMLVCVLTKSILPLQTQYSHLCSVTYTYKTTSTKRFYTKKKSLRGKTVEICFPAKFLRYQAPLSFFFYNSLKEWLFRGIYVFEFETMSMYLYGIFL